MATLARAGAQARGARLGRRGRRAAGLREAHAERVALRARGARAVPGRAAAEPRGPHGGHNTVFPRSLLFQVLEAHGVPMGATVALQSLQARSDLNGRTARVTGFDTEKERFAVVVDGTYEFVSLRRSHFELLVLPEESAAPAPVSPRRATQDTKSRRMAREQVWTASFRSK